MKKLVVIEEDTVYMYNDDGDHHLICTWLANCLYDKNKCSTCDFQSKYYTHSEAKAIIEARLNESEVGNEA